MRNTNGNGKFDLVHLGEQLIRAKDASEVPELRDAEWPHLDTLAYHEVLSLRPMDLASLRANIPIPPERYREEMQAFQAWMEIAHRHASNAVVVRAQVITNLYVAFVWLRDSVLKPVSDALGKSTVFGCIFDFLNVGTPRRLRNAVARGRWTYSSEFGGLECWDGPPEGPFEHFTVSQRDLNAWQMVSRAMGIAAILALSEAGRAGRGTSA